jgi:hypothetical protein
MRMRAIKTAPGGELSRDSAGATRTSAVVAEIVAGAGQKEEDS